MLHEVEFFTINNKFKEEIQFEWHKQKCLSTDKCFCLKYCLIFRECTWARHLWNLKTDIFNMLRGQVVGQKKTVRTSLTVALIFEIFVENHTRQWLICIFYYCCRVSILVPIGYCAHKEWERRCGTFSGVLQRYNRHKSEDYSRR